MKKHGKTANLRLGFKFVTVILVLLAILAGVALLWEHQLYGDEGTEPKLSATEGTEAAQVTMPAAEDAMNGKQVLNVLITGQDWWSEAGVENSDTMILCSINAETDTVAVVSFLRDLYLDIPGTGMDRLNEAFTQGGAELLKETLTANFDVQIDGSIELDFLDVIAVIDHLGGVKVELTAKEAEYINENQNLYLNAGENKTLEEGENVLSGAQAPLYARIREIDGESDRTQRQNEVLTQLLGKLRELNEEELQAAMDMLLKNSRMSFTEEELLLYTMGFTTVVMDSQVAAAQIPAEGTWEYADISGESVVQADLDQNREMLKQLLGAAE